MEIARAVICAETDAQRDDLVRLARDAGAGIVAALTPADPASRELPIDRIDAYVVHCGALLGWSALRDLIATKRVAVIAIGEVAPPAGRLRGWFAEAPPASVLAALLAPPHLTKPPQSRTHRDDSPLSWRRKTDMIVGQSQALRELLHTLSRLATSPIPVLVTGESGTGKELVARALHYCGPRADQPFIAINCAAIPENLFEAELFGYQRGAFTGAIANHAGAFESAQAGTLFLDEIGEMPKALQAKLLRVIERSEVVRLGSTEVRPVHARVVAATNRDLTREVREGRFREDLYYRLRVYPVHVPPLRDRPDDVPPLVSHYLALIAKRDQRSLLRLTSAALEGLVSYTWPGNVRELVNCIERAALLAPTDTIDVAHIAHVTGEATGAIPSYRDAKLRFEADYYSQVMRAAGGNISLTAKLAHKTRKEVYDAMKRLGLDVSRFRDDDEIGA